MDKTYLGTLASKLQNYPIMDDLGDLDKNHMLNLQMFNELQKARLLQSIQSAYRQKDNLSPTMASGDSADGSSNLGY